MGMGSARGASGKQTREQVRNQQQRGSPEARRRGRQDLKDAVRGHDTCATFHSAHQVYFVVSMPSCMQLCIGRQVNLLLDGSGFRVVEAILARVCLHLACCIWSVRWDAAADLAAVRSMEETLRLVCVHVVCDRWEAAADLAAVRCMDDVAPAAGKSVTEISACAVAGRIAGAGVPLNIAAGWLDSTAGPAIHIFVNAAKAPGELKHLCCFVWQLVLPPCASAAVLLAVAASCPSQQRPHRSGPFGCLRPQRSV